MKRNFIFLLFSVLYFSGYAQNGVYITPGAKWVCTGSPMIVFKNVSEFVNNGTFDAGKSTVEIQEGTVQTALGTLAAGASPIKFFNLNINSSKGAKLQQPVGIGGKLTFLKGKLSLKNKPLDLDLGAFVIGENESKRLVDDLTKAGQVSITKTIGIANNINPGNLGVRFVSTASPLGTTTVKRYCGVIAVNGNTTGVIQRYYKILKQFNSGLNAKVNFYYLKAELNGGLSASNAFLWKSGDNGTTWTSVTPDIRDTVAKFLQKGGMNTFPVLWTIGSATGAKMPMIVEAFNVKETTKGNALTWSVQEENGFDQFILEKSADAETWNAVGTINSIGVNSGYNFNDPFAGAAYYRLKELAKGGDISYSDIVKVTGPVSNVSIMLYPNPARNYFNVAFTAPTEAKYQVQLLSASGEVVKTMPVLANKGSNNILMNVRGLPAGTYTLSIKDKGVDFSKRVVLQ